MLKSCVRLYHEIKLCTMVLCLHVFYVVASLLYVVGAVCCVFFVKSVVGDGVGY